MIRHFSFLISVFLTVVFAGCGTSSGLLTKTKPTRIVIDPPRSAIAVGQEQVYTAKGISEGGTIVALDDVTWFLSNTSVARFLLSSEGRNGTVTGESSTLTTIAAGTVTLTATWGSLQATATLIVTPSAVQAIDIKPASDTIEVRQKQSFTVTAKLASGASQDLTNGVIWSVPDRSIAVINDTGVVTAVSPGTTTVVAVSGKVRGTATLTVKSPDLTAIRLISPGSVVAGLTKQLVAEGSFTNDTRQALTSGLTWSSSDTAIVTVDNRGLATAVAKGVKSPITITVTAASGKISGATTLTITPPELTGIQLTPAIPFIAAGRTQSFTAEGALTDGTTRSLTNDVTWSSSDTAIAAIDGKTGLATAITQGVATITAVFEKMTGTAKLTVTPPELTEMRVSPMIPFVAAGLTQQFVAEGTFTDGQDRKLISDVTWSSSDPSLVTINSDGVATAVAQGVKSPRVVEVTAASGAFKSTARLTITPPEITGLHVTPAIPLVAAGRTQQFTAEALLTDNTTQPLPSDVTWSSSDPSAVTIDKNGLATVVAKETEKQSTVRITAAFKQFSGKAQLTIIPPELVAIAVIPAIPFVAAGKTQSFTVEGTFSNGTTRPLTNDITWSSSNTLVAAIDSQTGLATALTPGVSTMTAVSGEIRGKAQLTVTAAELIAIRMNPNDATIMTGRPLQFHLEGTFTDGTTQPLSSDVVWSSSDPSIVTIDSNGSARVVAEGMESDRRVTITAVSGKMRGTANLTVTAPTLAAIEVVSDNLSVVAGKTQPLRVRGTFIDGTTRFLTSGVTWFSSDMSVATVDPRSGLATAVGPGMATITAVSGKVEGAAQFTVARPVLTAIRIRPDRPSVPSGTTQPFFAEGVFSDGTTQPLTSDITWSSSDTSVATIDGRGVATTSARGVDIPLIVKIIAMSGEMRGQTTMVVLPP